jgi:hypothetical protein
MGHHRAFRLALGAGLLSLTTLVDADVGSADPLVPGASVHGHRSSPASVVVLSTNDLQPIANSFALGINRTSFNERHLWVIADIVNLSAITYGHLRLLVSAEHGARRRVRVGMLPPGRSRRVQVRLPTRCDYRPQTLRVGFLKAVATYQPMPKGIAKAEHTDR